MSNSGARGRARQKSQRSVEELLREAAIKAGVGEKHVERSLSAFASAVIAGRATDPSKFFSALRKTHAHLFTGQNAGAAPSVQKDVVDVMNMSEAAFGAYRRSKYGAV